ncbi:zinc-binding alcohol dehydrogenase family protein [Rugamonas sp.]|uniref:quinone oxidoreductase family protein n=1 Tax=Rugamonas sp. TaxID=1926287 RepID=UPI0025F05A06|nr:zinc-binding alcohol dehydrogenase family protein [Rugamonas sp.]
MKAALVQAAGATPVYGDFAAPGGVADGMARVTVAASALSHVTKSRASGKHYSASGGLPFVPGVDGTGVLDDGTRVYFFLPEAPFGGMAEVCLVRKAHCIALPPELGDVMAAAIAIPGMSSWAALMERARLVAGETVLINGATGSSGRLAVQIAKYLGAGKVIATGRNAQALQSLHAVGADVTINLAQDAAALEHALQSQFRDGIDVVLDYLWGASAEQLLAAATRATPDAVPLRFIQIGAISGPDITLPSAALRSSSIELKGSGMGSISLPRILHTMQQLLQDAVPAGLEIATNVIPLAQVAEHWTDQGQARVVFTMGLG